MTWYQEKIVKICKYNESQFTGKKITINYTGLTTFYCKFLLDE